MKHFPEWCDDEDIDNLNNLSDRDIQRYQPWLADDDDVSALTMKNMISGFHAFLEWADSVGAIPENLYSKLMIPRVRRSQQSSEKILEAEEAEKRLAYLSRYEYTPMHRVLPAFLWETGMRMRAAYSVDLTDLVSVWAFTGEALPEDRTGKRRLGASLHHDDRPVMRGAVAYCRFS